MFWLFVYGTALVLLLLFVREIVLLLRIKTDDPERGLYWFNICMFFFGAILIVGVAYYLENRKIRIESTIAPFPGARFEPHHSIVSGDVFIYTTSAAVAEVESFYRATAHERGLPIVVDKKGERGTTIAIGKSPPVFLSIIDRGYGRELHYSLKGEIVVTDISNEPQQ